MDRILGVGLRGFTVGGGAMLSLVTDLSPFNRLEIFALTLIGESESLGENGMRKTASVIMNRQAANKGWMGGNDVRNICLQQGQFDCWWPTKPNADRDRIISIGLENPLYQPYRLALQIAQTAMAGELHDSTKHAVSYVDGNAKADIVGGAMPCLVDGQRRYYDLAAVGG